MKISTQRTFCEITEWWDRYYIDKQISPHFFLYPAKMMLSKGFEVTVLTKMHPTLEKSSIYDGIKILRFPCKLRVPYLLNIDFSNHLIKHLFQRKYALVHLHSLLPGEVTLALLALRRRKVPVVFTSHYFTFHEGYKSTLKKMGSILQNKSLKAGDHNRCIFHAFTKFQARIYRRYGIKGKIVVIPHGIDPKVFEVKKQEYVKEKYGLKDFNILCVANFSERKGQHLLIKAIKNITDKYPLVKSNLKLVLVGRVFGSSGEEYLKLLKSYIRLNDLTENVSLILDPPRNDLLQLYLNSDLFVLPTAKESFGLIFLEAMAAGLPIISINIPPINEILSNGKEALLCKRNINDLSKCITILLFDDNLRKKMSYYARKKVYEKYHLENIKKQLWYVYKSLL